MEQTRLRHQRAELVVAADVFVGVVVLGRKEQQHCVRGISELGTPYHRRQVDTEAPQRSAASRRRG